MSNWSLADSHCRVLWIYHSFVGKNCQLCARHWSLVYVHYHMNLWQYHHQTNVGLFFYYYYYYSPSLQYNITSKCVTNTIFTLSGWGVFIILKKFKNNEIMNSLIYKEKKRKIIIILILTTNLK